MKIGAFSEYYQSTPGTIRFYVNKGLLVPLIRNNRYDFDENDMEDMQVILKLKSFRFSIADIHKILSLRRLSNFNSLKELEDYIHILSNHKKRLQEEKRHIQSIIAELNSEIVKVTGEHHSLNVKNKNGVPLVFLEYFACPLCSGALSLSHCNIERDQILSGELNCPCGFKAVIRNGILIGSPGKISLHDWPDCERNCYRLMNPTLVSYMQRAYHWMLERLKQCETSGKLILEDFINNYCFCHANLEKMDANALYVITDKYPEIVAIYKGLIDRLGFAHKVLYVASASNLLPLREKCVDIYIDFDSANEYALYNSGYAAEAVSRYFRKNACTVGAFFSFKPRSPSMQELHRQFPEAWEKSYDIGYFRQYLHRTWNDVIDEEEIGNVLDEVEEKAYSYHIPGEVRMNVYFARGYNGA